MADSNLGDPRVQDPDKMATVVLTPRIPALDIARGFGVLQKSRDDYNGLLNKAKRSSLLKDQTLEPAVLFICHMVQRTLGFHLIHGHFNTPENTVTLGSSFENACGRWTKVMDVDGFDRHPSKGQMFVFTSDVFIAYEHHDGALPDLSSVMKGSFTRHFTELIKAEGVGIYDLQVFLVDANGPTLWEQFPDITTVMLDGIVVRGCLPTRVTAWKFEARDEQRCACEADGAHAEMTSGNYKVSDDGRYRHPTQQGQ